MNIHGQTPDEMQSRFCLALCGWAGPLVFGLLVYFSVAHYGDSSLGYNRQVAGYVVVAASAILISLTFTGRRLIVDRRILLIASALIASVAYSTLTSPSFHWAVNRLHLYYGVLTLGCAFYFLHSQHQDKVIEKYFLVISAVHVCFVAEVTFWAIASASESGWDVGLPNYANIRHFAYHGFLAAAAGSSLFLISSKLKLIAWVLASVALFGIVLLGARGAIAAWGIYVALSLFFHRKRLPYLLFLASALAVASATVYYLAEVGAIHLTTLFHRFAGGTETALYAADRVEVWRQAAVGVAQHPWFGSGPEAFIMSGCCKGNLAQPHNFVLQFLLEFGAVGLALLALLAGMVFARFDGSSTLQREFGRNAELTALAAVLAGFIAYAMVDGLLYHAIPLVHFALLLALLMVVIGGVKKPRDGAAVMTQ